VEHRPFASSRGGGAKLIRAEWSRVSESVADHFAVARFSLIPCAESHAHDWWSLRDRDDEHEAIRRPPISLITVFASTLSMWASASRLAS
jgi:hypothetical protein